MASAIPGGAPGYDDDKEFGNIVTHIAAGILEGCANHSGEPWNVKGKRPANAIWVTLVPF
jgi:hypothetical protein